MEVSTTIWAITVGLIATLIAIDLFTSSRTAHDVSFKEAQDLLLEHLQALGKNDELQKLKQAFNPTR